MRKIIIAIDSFKGCLSSIEVEDAVEKSLKSIFSNIETVCIPISDGGDGFLDSVTKLRNYSIRETQSFDALMRKTQSKIAISDDGEMCIVESALSCGLNLLDKNELRPLVATSYGVGIDVANAISEGANQIVVGLGGSATSDCGIGMLHAMIDRFCPKNDVYCLREYLKTNCPRLRFTIAADVNTVLYGENGAAYTFGKQKGASPDDIELLDRRAITFARMAAKRMGVDYSEAPGSGAAGGLGYAFMQFLDAEMLSGIELVLRLSKFENHLSDADLVITGEGKADCQTLQGKAPYGIMRLSKRANVPTLLIAGQVSDSELLHKAGFNHIVSLVDSTQTGTANAQNNGDFAPNLDAKHNCLLIDTLLKQLFSGLEK